MEPDEAGIENHCPQGTLKNVRFHLEGTLKNVRFQCERNDSLPFAPDFGQNVAPRFDVFSIRGSGQCSSPPRSPDSASRITAGKATGMGVEWEWIVGSGGATRTRGFLIECPATTEKQKKKHELSNNEHAQRPNYHLSRARARRIP